MRQIYSGKSQYVPPGVTARQLHTGRGKVFAVIASTTATVATTVALYDTLTSGGGLFAAAVSPNAPLVIFFPQNTPLVFETGLQATTAAGTFQTVITEAEA